MMISNHTFSNLILRPNGVAPTTIGPDGNPVGNAPDEKGLKALGAEMSAQNGYVNQNSWQLYDTTGTTEDWSYNATGGYGYTFEIGPDEFHPPFPAVVDEYLGAGEHEGLGNRAAYLLALEHAVDTAKHGVLKGKAPKGATLRLRKDFESPTWESSFEDFLDSTITVGKKGRFSWVVNPSTRPLQQSRPIQQLDEEPFAGETIEGGATEPVVGTVDHEYVATKASDVLRIDLDWPTPDDFDLEVYRKDASGELVEVGTLGQRAGLQGAGPGARRPRRHVRGAGRQLRLGEPDVHRRDRAVRAAPRPSPRASVRSTRSAARWTARPWPAARSSSTAARSSASTSSAPAADPTTTRQHRTTAAP